MIRNISRQFRSVAAINIFAFLIILFIIVIPAAYKYLSDIEENLTEILATRLEVTAQQGASLLKVEDITTLASPKFLFTPEHDGVVKALRKIQTTFSVDNAVIYRRLPDDGFVYVADGYNQFKIGSPVALHQRFPATRDAALRAWKSGQMGTTDMFDSGDYKYFQINLPLKIEGKVVAVLMLNKFATPIAEEIRRRQVVIVVTLGIVMMAGIILFWIVSQRTLRPLQRLRGAALEISRGNLDVEIPAARGRNEITELTCSFRQMVSDLQESREQLLSHREHLEDLVYERTANLEKSNELLHREIVERERAQHALAESEKYLALILDSAPDGIITFSNSGEILGFNKSAEKMMGYSAQEIIGKSVETLLPSPFRERTSTYLKRYKGEERQKWLGREQEIAGLRKDGTSFPLMAKVSEVRTSSRSTFTAIVRDISELKRYEEQLIEADRAKMTFLSRISHELRNPLSAIIGFTQLLQRDPDLNDEHRHDLRIIADSSDQLLELINDVLDISKIEAGKIELSEENFDLHGLIHSLVEMFRLRAEEKGLALEADIAPGVPVYVLGDQAKVRQVLANLLSNAVKFTEEGSVNIRLQKSGQGIEFRVSDTGPGIDDSQRNLVFEPFRQTDSGKFKSGGTGLGLSISMSFVQAMGGTLGLTSEPGAGSIFCFTLDLPPVEENGDGNRNNGKIVAGLEGDREWRVLIVDDDDFNRQYLGKTLGSVGFLTEEADNGQSAIEIFKKFNPNLILMDIQMPIMDGLEATRRIREMEGGMEIPIIALSAHALDHDVEEILAAGCDEMIPKPFDEAFLFERMAGFLSLKYYYG